MPYPRSANKTYNLIIETRELEEQVGELLLKIDENKSKIQAYFDENNEKEIRVPVLNNTTLVCKKQERVNMTYDVEKLKSKLDSELFLEVTKRSYTIKDINKMIEMIKDAGVKAKDFKALIEADVKVDAQAIKRLYDVGEITMKQLQGAYTAKISKSIKITEEAGEKDC